jgi:hypothetical protein
MTADRTIVQKRDDQEFRIAASARPEPLLDQQVFADWGVSQ